MPEFPPERIHESQQWYLELRLLQVRHQLQSALPCILHHADQGSCREGKVFIVQRLHGSPASSCTFFSIIHQPIIGLSYTNRDSLSIAPGVYRPYCQSQRRLTAWPTHSVITL